MLKKVFNYQFPSIFLVLFSGCSATQQQAQKETAKSQHLAMGTVIIQPLPTEKVPALEKKSDQYYTVFNQQKFWTKLPDIRVGVAVFNIQLNEYAFVTNKVVAVLKDSSRFREDMYLEALGAKSKFVTPDKVNFHFIAHSVVEFSFTNKKVNMLEMYQVISAMPNVAQTELLLQYRDKNSPSQF